MRLSLGAVTLRATDDGLRCKSSLKNLPMYATIFHWLSQLSAWLERTKMNQTIQVHDWIVPVVQSIHILGIAVVASSALMINLRLLGLYAADARSAPLHLDRLRRRHHHWLAAVFLQRAEICAQFLLPGQDGIARACWLQHGGLSSDRHTRDRALGRGGRDAGRGQDRGGHLASGLDRGGGVWPLGRLSIALVRPQGYLLVTARISIARRATYAIPTASDVCCARLDGGGRRPERTEEAADHHQSAADRAGLRRSRQVAGLERRVEPEDQRPRPAGAQ